MKLADPAQLLATLDTTGMRGDVFTWCRFDDWSAEFARLAPDVSIKVNIDDAAGAQRAIDLFNATIVEVGPDHLTPTLIDTCHGLGHRVMVNYMGADERILREIFQWDIDMINTDHGDLCMALAAEMGRRQWTRWHLVLLRSVSRTLLNFRAGFLTRRTNGNIL